MKENSIIGLKTNNETKIEIIGNDDKTELIIYIYAPWYKRLWAIASYIFKGRMGY